jgi:hypothetical protein
VKSLKFQANIPRQLMSNPEALAAIMQIQQGMDRLRAAAPDFYQSMDLPTLA